MRETGVDEMQVEGLMQVASGGSPSTRDQQSAYMTPDMDKEMQVETKGEFGGVGIQIGVKESRLAVDSAHTSDGMRQWPEGSER